MSFLHNLRTRTRLNLAFGAMLLLTAFQSGWAVLKLSQLNRATQEIVTRHWEKAQLANRAAGLAQANGIATLNLFLLVGSDDIDRLSSGDLGVVIQERDSGDEISPVLKRIVASSLEEVSAAIQEDGLDDRAEHGERARGA